MKRLNKKQIKKRSKIKIENKSNLESVMCNLEFRILIIIKKKKRKKKKKEKKEKRKNEE
jgi:hypothetical protein